MKRPVHREEDVVVDDLGLVVEPGLVRVEADHVDDLGDAEAAAPVRPDHLEMLDMYVWRGITVYLLLYTT